MIIRRRDANYNYPVSNLAKQEHFNKKLRPKKDDEVISLEPIGPGVQLLEPEIGTLRGQTLRYQGKGFKCNKSS